MEHDREEPRIGELEESASADSDKMTQRENRRSFAPWAIAIVVALAVALFLYPEPAEDPVTGPQTERSSVPPAVVELPPAPDIPVVEPEPVQEAPGAAPAAEIAPSPPALTLDDSDEAVRTALSSVGNTALVEAPLQQEDLLQRGAAVVDGFSRGLVLTGILSPPRPAGKFTTLEEQGQELIDPASYERYDGYARAIADLDTQSLVSAFHRFRPLLEEAYAQLGYPAAEFDNALIRSLDLVIATPEISEDIAVKPKGGLYVFADPALEALPPIQKQLLRMGPDNRMLVKQQARELRSALLGEQAQ